MAKIIGINGYRLSPTNTGKNEHQSTKRVKMSQRIKTKAAIGFRGGVAETIGGPGVSEFMNSQGNNKRN
jgi:hypothetical protein